MSYKFLVSDLCRAGLVSKIYSWLAKISVKSAQIRIFALFVFSCIRTECGDLMVNFPIQPKYRNIDQKNSVFEHLSRSVTYQMVIGSLLIIYCKRRPNNVSKISMLTMNLFLVYLISTIFMCICLVLYFCFDSLPY